MQMAGIRKSLFVTEPGSAVDAEDGRLRVFRNGCVVADGPLNLCGSLTLFGGVDLKRRAADALCRAGACVHFVSWAGEPVGTLWPNRDRGAAHRMVQAVACSDADRRLELADWLVRRKIASHRHTLAQRNWESNLPSVDAAIARLDRLQCAPPAHDLKSVRALEARAARTNFEAVNALLPAEFRFQSRTRRPPADPFNALLGLGYTVATNEVLRMIRAKGLDPYVGFLHETYRNNPALACDLVEPFRSPWVERWAVNMVRKRVVSLDDFERDERGGVRLADRAELRKVLGHLSRMLVRPLPRGLGSGHASCETAMSSLVTSLTRSFETGGPPDWEW